MARQTVTQDLHAAQDSLGDACGNLRATPTSLCYKRSFKPGKEIHETEGRHVQKLRPSEVTDYSVR